MRPAKCRRTRHGMTDNFATLARRADRVAQAHGGRASRLICLTTLSTSVVVALLRNIMLVRHAARVLLGNSHCT